MKYNKIFISLLIITGFLYSENPETFTRKPQKKQPKITVQECCDQIFEARELDARILHSTGIIQSIELAWGRDCIENAAGSLLGQMTSEQLQDFYNHKKKCNVIRKDYEKALREERDFLVMIEQSIMKNKK